MTSLGDQTTRPIDTEVFASGGEMGALMRTLDWAATPIGPVEGWPQSLRTAVSICLASRFPMLIWWGPELVMLYNDAYRPMLGATKHPRAMGQRGRDCWPEIWDVIGPMLKGVIERGEATYSEDQLLLLDRNGYVEECYFTFSYSPIRDETGGISGVFTAVTETTERVLGERRMATLRELAAHTAEARTDEDACAVAVAALSGNPADVPFSLLYLLDAEGRTARLVGTSGLNGVAPASLQHIDLAAGDTHLARSNAVEVVDGVAAHVGWLPVATEIPPRQALVLPVAQAGQDRVAGLLVAGISPRRALDDDYRGFFALVAGQIATAIADARAYEEERKRAEALAELDRAKTAFFSNVSHEFRTPLTLLLGPLEEALAASPETPLGHERAQLESAQRNGLRLLRLVNTLLDFSRIEAGRVEAAYEPTDLAAYTAELASAFRSAIERAGLRLAVDCPPLPAPVYADREMWEKVVLNLLSNALKFTFEGEIAVRLRPIGEWVELEVRDTGTGIPAAELPHLFERFHRVRGARARTQEGTGIGLALVRELARLHGGEVRVASAVGAGTTFTVALPLGGAHLPPERINAAQTLTSTALGAAPYVEEALRWLPNAAPGNTLMAERSPDETAPPGDGVLAARVLLADDNADMRAYLGRLLGARYAVEAVADGAEALAAARARPPDLVLADVMMPGLDGFALLRELRADPRTRTLPVLLLSARAGQEATAAGLEAGADDYLVKPFAAGELLARVQAHLALARLRKEATETERTLRAAAQAAQAVAEAERRHLRDVFMQAPAFIAVLRGPTHVFEVANPPYVRLVGRHGPDELLGHPIREALPEVEGQGYFELLDRVYATGEPFVGREMPARLDRHGAGTLDEILVNFVYQPYRDAQGQVEGVFVHAVEVTEQAQARRRAEELARQVQDERDRWRQILDVLPVGVVIVDAQGRVEALNRAGRDIVGRDTRGQRLPAPGDEDIEQYRVRRPDGTPYPPHEIPLRRSLLSGEEVRGDQEIHRHAVTGQETPLLVNSAPLRDATGAIVGAVAVFQDITALRDLERAREEFLSSAAHDLKTPLTSIRGMAQLSQRRLTRPTARSAETAAAIATSLAQIDASTERMLSLINELVDVTRVQMGAVVELDRRPADLVALVRAVVAMQKGAAMQRIHVDAAVAELECTVDAARIERSVGNLLSNAIKYSPDGSAITVRVAREDGAMGAEAVIAVQDQGMGIPAADLPHIFDRFHRASNVVGHIQGTGIGLASVRHIVEQHGGTIAAESQEGVGSTFTIRLPLTPRPPLPDAGEGEESRRTLPSPRRGRGAGGEGG